MSISLYIRIRIGAARPFSRADAVLFYLGFILYRTIFCFFAAWLSWKKISTTCAAAWKVWRVWVTKIYEIIHVTYCSVCYTMFSTELFFNFFPSWIIFTRRSWSTRRSDRRSWATSTCRWWVSSSPWPASASPTWRTLSLRPRSWWVGRRHCHL